MKAIEREIFRKLIDVANENGFKVRRFACTPATGESGDEIANPTFEQCIEHANAWDSDSVAEFTNGRGGYFWVLLIWGNGEDVISDYLDTLTANVVIDEVYEWIG